MNLTRALVIGVASMLMACGVGAAEPYPTRPVSLLVPYPVGGSSDIIAPIQQQILGTVDAGRMKIIGTLEPAGTRDVPMLKKYSSINEGAHAKDFTFRLWHAYFVRKETPEVIVERLNKELDVVLRDTKVIAQLGEQGLVVAAPGTLAEAARAYDAEVARYQRIAQTIKLLPQRPQQ